MAIRWADPQPVKQLPYGAFLPLLRAAVAAAPDRADLALHLARALFHTDATAELVATFRPAADDERADPELLFYLGRAAAAVFDERLALRALKSAAENGFGPAFGHLAHALHALDRDDESLAAALRGLAASPSDFNALVTAAHILFDRGETARLWSVCAELRARGASGGYLPSMMAAAAATHEQAGEVASLLDLSRWLSSIRLDVSDDFNRGLAAELSAHASAAALPSSKATAGAGRRIDQLHLTSGPLARELHARIRAAVEGYAAERERFADHPMIAARPHVVTLESWALSVHDDGHETWHLHPSGWISGVYYVDVPHLDRSQNAAGSIEFGMHAPGRADVDLRWPHRRVNPQRGMLLLFPSYLPHRTLPTGVREPRICVAFDVASARPATASVSASSAAHLPTA